MISLKDFIQETLTQISEATIEFAANKGDTGANPNPPLTHGENAASHGLLAGEFNDGKNRYDTIMPVEFDVAVSAEESESKEGKGGVRVMSFIKADGSIAKETVASSVSRVKFHIPLRLPDTGAQGKPALSLPDHAISDY